MGTVKKGHPGAFTGKLGTAIGSNWKGIDVIRSRPPRKQRGQPSEIQLECQARFSLMTKFLRPVTELLNQTFKKSAVKMTCFNKAFSYHIQFAITGIFPDFQVDYPKVILSKGSLPGAFNPMVVSQVTGKLVFSWTDNSNIRTALNSDHAFVAAYNEELNQWVFLQKAAARNAGTYTLDVTPFSGKPVQTYIGFMSADRKKVATSVYTGLVNIL